MPNRMQLCLVLSGLFFSSFLAAQQTVTGVVTGSDGEPLIGVNIVIKDTNEGAITDLDGAFSIEADKGDVLVFSFLGYISQEIQLGEQVSLDITMQEDSKLLEEVVVIGYGTARRSEVTGSIASIKSEDIDRLKSTSFEQALQGQVAGVQVVQTEGGPDAAMKIRVRGATSVNAGNDPLYVIDGFPLSGAGVGISAGEGNSSVNPLSTIDPANIESIEILKDASAAAIYGSRGANGVVIITTKKGRSGSTNMTYRTYGEVSVLANRLPVLSPEGFIKFRNDFQEWNPTLTDQKKYLAETYRVNDGTGTYVPVNLQDTMLLVDDWQDLIMRDAFSHYHSLGINGGDFKTRYNANFSYLNREGIIRTSGIERFTGSLNVSQRINEKLRAGINVNGGRTSRAGVITSAENNGQGRAGIVTNAVFFNPVQPIRHPDNEETIANLGIEFDEDGRMIRNQNGDLGNPVALLNENINESVISQVGLNAFLEFTLSEGFTFTSSLRLFTFNSKTESYFSERIGWARSVGGQAFVNDFRSASFVTEQNLNYRKRIGNHSINATGVLETQTQSQEFLGLSANGFELPGVNLDNLGSALNTLPSNSNAASSTLVSLLGRLNYSFKDKYVLTLSGRYDGSSKFADKWGFFPAAGVSWRLSEEPFLKGSNFITDARVKASYGVTGNNNIQDFLFLEAAGAANYVFNGDDITTGATLTRPPNNSLTWETTTQFDAGFAVELFDRLTLEVDLYEKTTEDLLLAVPVPSTSGFELVFQNLGEVQNRGLEIALSGDVLRKKSFTWNSSFNISFNRNEVIDIGENGEIFITAIGDRLITDDYLVRAGLPLGTIYGLQTDGVYTFSDFVEFEGLTDAQAAAKIRQDALIDNGDGTFTFENWYSSNIYTLREGVVENALLAPGTYRPGMQKYVDTNGDGVINADDRTVIGNTQPDFIGGFTNKFSYKAFDLTVQTTFSYGNDIYNKNIVRGIDTNTPWANKLEKVNERWSPEDTDNTLPSFNVGASGIFNSIARDLYIEDGSYLRIANVTLGYIMPRSIVERLGLSNVRIYGAVNNLHVFTNYSGWDPDVSVGNNPLTPGLDADSYPRERSFRLGLDVTF
jgi:TonB-linked SusC/RagA family outer membrane protein